MQTETAAIRIERSADDIWALVGEFGGLETWLPGVEACEVDGDVRQVHTMGLVITERLVARDAEARSLTYSITSGAPVEVHEATITVASADGGAAEVTWSVSTEPDDASLFMRDVYQGALDAVKAQLEG